MIVQNKHSHYKQYFDSCQIYYYIIKFSQIFDSCQRNCNCQICHLFIFLICNFDCYETIPILTLTAVKFNQIFIIRQNIDVCQ